MARSFAYLPLLLCMVVGAWRAADVSPPVLTGGLTSAARQPPGVIRTLNAPAFRQSGAVTELAIVNGGKQIISGSWNEGAILWDVATGRRLEKLAERVSMAMALSPKGDLLAVRTGSKGITVYNLATDKVQFSFQAENPLVLAFSPDGKTLASGWSNDYEIRLWNTATGEVAGTLKGHTLVVFAVAFHPDGKTLYSVSHDGTFRHWDLASGKEIRRLTEAAGWYGYSLALSADGKTLATEAGTGAGFSPDNYQAKVRLFDTATLEERFSVALPASRAQDVAVSADGRYVAAAFAKAKPEDGSMRLWDAVSGKQIRLDPGNAQPIYRVSFFPDGKTLASAGNDGVVRLWNVADGMEHSLTKGPGTGRVEQLAFSPVGNILASVTGDGPIQLWDMDKGTALRDIGKDAAANSGLAFSADAKHLVSVAVKKAVISAFLWDVQTGQCLHSFQHVKGRPAFSPDGKVLAIADDEQNVRLWDVAKGTELRRLKAERMQAHAVAFSPDSRLLAAASDDFKVRLWHIATGNTVRTLHLNQAMAERLWFSPDGLLLFISYGLKYPKAGIIEVFDIAAGECVVTVNASIGMPQAIWPTPGGRALIVASAPGKFRKLNLTGGGAVGGDVTYGGEFTTAEFTTDGKMLALGYDDGRILLWEPPPMPTRNQVSATVDEARLRENWMALAGADGILAYKARWLLSSRPQQTLPLLRAELRPVPPVAAKQVDTWITQLDSDSFKDRENALRNLEKAGEAFRPALIKALEKNTTLEMRQRVELLLNKLAAPASGETLRTLRAVAILESIGGEEAGAILTDLAGGAPGSLVTEAAKGALKRLR
jgi:WD40 repeat protein